MRPVPDIDAVRSRWSGSLWQPVQVLAPRLRVKIGATCVGKLTMPLTGAGVTRSSAGLALPVYFSAIDGRAVTPGLVVSAQ